MKTVLFLAFILLLQLPINAQENDPVDLKEYFYDAEFFFAQEEYSDALNDYMEVYNNGYKDNANLNYRIGICYLNIPGQKEKSINYLLEAVKNVSEKYSESTLKQKNAPFDAWLFLGNAYRVNNNLDKAIGAYNKYKELVGTAEEIKYAEQQISACALAKRYMDNPVKVKFHNLGDSVNGNSSNFKGVVSADGRTLVYMNELPFYNAVYFSTFNGRDWTSPVNITPQLQSDGDQYVSCISPDGKTLFLTKEDAFNSDLYMSNFENGKWTKSLPLNGQDINTKFWESHASVSADGKTMIFTSNRKDGAGEMDLYISQKQNNGDWGQPKNLGPVVNTPLNEDTPFLTSNDSLLYFSSQGHESMGGYDIFVTRLTTNGEWSAPENIRYPINTTDDDLFFYPWDDGKIGFVSRIMNDGYGKEDLYAVQPEGDKSYDLVFAGLIGNQITGTLVEEPSELNPVISDNSEPDDKVAETETKPVTVVPEKPVPSEIQLDPVYFAFDHFELSQEGKNQLNKVFQLMKDHPEVRIKLVGHADAKGPAVYNLELSGKRATATLNYLKSLGVDGSRMEILAMGEKNFAAINSNPDGTDNPEGRKLNRRVEYEIVGPEDSIILIRMSPVPDNLKAR